MLVKRNMQPMLPPKGYHKATITGMKEGKVARTSYGETETGLVTFQTDGLHVVQQSILLYSNGFSLLDKLIDATCGKDAEDVDLNTLVEKKCGIKVEHKLHRDRLYANVVDICSIGELVEEESQFTPPTQEISMDELELD